MAKRDREKTDEPFEYLETEQPEAQKGFWSRLFTPIPEDEEEPSLVREAEEREAARLFADAPAVKKKKKRRIPDEALVYDETADEAAQVLDDGEPDAPEAPRKKKKKRPAAEDGEEAYPALPAAAEPEAPPEEAPALEEAGEAAVIGAPRVATGRIPAPDADKPAAEESAWRIADAPAEVSQAETEDEAGPDEFEGYAEHIRLFDDEDDSDAVARKKHDTTRTRLFRTGTQTTTRIHINETEETLRIEAAERKAREREATIRREAAAERKNKRNKRTAVIRKLFSNVAFVLFFIVALIVALYYGFLLSDIVVMGNEKYSTDYIIGLSGLKTGTHMLLCNLDEAEAGISEDPYLQVDSMNYIFPSRIRIIVTERKEAAGIIGLDYNVIIDKNGYVLSMSGGTDISGLLQVTGVSMTGFQLGQRLGEGDDFTTATLIQIIDKLEAHQLMDAIKSIDLTTPLAITMTADNGLTVHLGQPTDLDAKMASLQVLLPQFVKQNIASGTLYLSAKGGTVYSPSGADANALTEAANTAANSTAATPTGDFVDDNNDGIDDLTGEPVVTPNPNTTPTPPPTPTPRVLGGESDAFSG